MVSDCREEVWLHHLKLRVRFAAWCLDCREEVPHSQEVPPRLMDHVHFVQESGNTRNFLLRRANHDGPITKLRYPNLENIYRIGKENQSHPTYFLGSYDRYWLETDPTDWSVWSTQLMSGSSLSFCAHMAERLSYPGDIIADYIGTARNGN